MDDPEPGLSSSARSTFIYKEKVKLNKDNFNTKIFKQ
jgi:hypothetical protein